MKKTLLSMLAVLTLIPAQAQLFSPESLGGAVWGGVLGGIIGGDCHNGFSGEGAAIGAGAGLLLGALSGEANRRNYYNSQPYAYESVPVTGYGYTTAPTYAYYAPNRYSAPGYYYQPNRPNYAVGGTLLGAASGALIGAGSHDAGKGAAIGAGAGLVLGSIAELTSRNHERNVAAQPAYTPLPLEQSQSVTQIDPSQNGYSQLPQIQITSKPATNSTYYWTAPQQQIPDAPRVPDAPKM